MRWLSSTVTSTSRRRRKYAAESPATPPPTMITCRGVIARASQPRPGQRLWRGTSARGRVGPIPRASPGDRAELQLEREPRVRVVEVGAGYLDDPAQPVAQGVRVP